MDRVAPQCGNTVAKEVQDMFGEKAMSCRLRGAPRLYPHWHYPNQQNRKGYAVDLRGALPPGMALCGCMWRIHCALVQSRGGVRIWRWARTGASTWQHWDFIVVCTLMGLPSLHTVLWWLGGILTERFVILGGMVLGTVVCGQSDEVQGPWPSLGPEHNKLEASGRVS